MREPGNMAVSCHSRQDRASIAISAYADLLTDEGTGSGWRWFPSRQACLVAMWRLALARDKATEQEWRDKAVITAAVKRLIARDISLPLNAKELVELGVEN